MTGRSTVHRLLERFANLLRSPRWGSHAASGSVLDSYVRTAPTAENAIKIFDGLWASKFPPPYEGLTGGYADLFADHRLRWAFERLGGVGGMRVLELGPLEGGHSYMLDRAGASNVVAIEGNSGAYLRCLVSKELLGMPSVSFLCGDFIQYLGSTRDRFDLCVASGVLYHMQQPIELIARLAAVAPRVLIWTHYYDEALLLRSAPRVRPGVEPVSAEYQGFKHRLYRYEYGRALSAAAFCGGNQPFAHWLTREDIFAALRYFGFREIATGPEHPEHPNGPALTLLATK